MQYPEFMGIVEQTRQERDVMMIAFGMSKFAVRFTTNNHMLRDPFVAVLRNRTAEQEPVYRVLMAPGAAGGDLFAAHISTVIELNSTHDRERGLSPLWIPHNIIKNGLLLHCPLNNNGRRDLFINGLSTVPQAAFWEPCPSQKSGLPTKGVPPG